MNIKVGFIGVGNMGSALATALLKKHPADCVLVADKKTEKSESFASENGCIACDAIRIVRECKYIFLGVKPQFMDNALSELAGELSKRKDRFILVTMAAGLTSETIMKLAGGEYPVIRIMPNTPVKVGQGMILVAPGKYVTEEETSEFLGLMEKSGRLDILPENLIDAGCSLSGCGPAFVFMFIQSMAHAGELLGLSEEQALLYAKQTVLGAAELALSSDESPEILKQRVCSPGGSTIEGVRRLEADNLSKTIEKALAASYKRNLELQNV